MVKDPPANAGIHGFEPWSGKIPHAVEWLSPHTSEPMLHNKRSHHKKKPSHHSRPCSPQLESSPGSDEDPAQPEIKIFKKKRRAGPRFTPTPRKGHLAGGLL